MADSCGVGLEKIYRSAQLTKHINISRAIVSLVNARQCRWKGDLHFFTRLLTPVHTSHLTYSGARQSMLAKLVLQTSP
jgi:hypothetical protein